MDDSYVIIQGYTEGCGEQTLKGALRMMQNDVEREATIREKKAAPYGKMAWIGASQYALALV